MVDKPLDDITQHAGQVDTGALIYLLSPAGNSRSAHPGQMAPSIDWADSGEARLGTDTGVVMSPLRVKQHMDYHWPVLYAVDYGFEPSNTAAGNTTAWGALRTAVGTGSKRIILPLGECDHNGLDCSDWTNVIIEGHGGRDLTYSGNNGTILNFTGTGAGNAIDMREHRGVWWRDVQIVYSSNSFTGVIVNMATTFTTGCGSGFERCQVYQIDNNLHTALCCFLVRNNVDVDFNNVYVSHADYGWIGLLESDATVPTNETNMIRLTNCTSIALQVHAIANPVIGWTCIGCNFEPRDAASGTGAAGIVATGAHIVKDLGLYACKCADSQDTGAGTWIDLPVNVFNFTMVGGAILNLGTGSTTGIKIGNVADTGTAFSGGIVISGVEFDGNSIGVDLQDLPVTGVTINGCNFLNTATPTSGDAGVDAFSVWHSNNPGTVTRGTGGSIGGTTGSTDERVLRSDGTGGGTIQASNIAITDTGAVSGVKTLAMKGNLSNTLSQTAQTNITVTNTDTGAAASAALRAVANGGTFAASALSNGSAGFTYTGTGGMSFNATAGEMVFSTSSFTERMRVRTAGEISHRADATVIVDASSHLGLRSYTVATLPSAATAARMIYVSDGTTNKRVAVSDATNWRFPDGNVVT